MNFTYQARDRNNAIRAGEITAPTIQDATRQLQQEGFLLLSIEELTAKATAAARGGLFPKRITRSEMVYLTNQLAVMVDAGVSITEALAGLARQTENPQMRSMLDDIEKHVQSGDDFSTAIARHPKQFDTTYVNLVKASEASGTLGKMLDRIAIQMAGELDTRKKVQGALMYPAAMLVMCVGVCGFLLAYVFPKLMPMFAARKVEVPGPTKFMMFTSNALVNYWWLILLALAALTGCFLYARKQLWGKITLNWLALNVPLLGPMFRKICISRSLRTLSMTINAGVPILDSLELCSGVSNNLFYERCWQDVAAKVTAGRQIHEALEGNRLFPQTLLQMISSGEATGKLGPVLDKVSDYYDRELANTIKTTTSLIEPLMVFLMGGVIGTIALAMLLPIFKLSGSGGG